MIKLDFNLETANDDANTQADFTMFTIADSSSEVNGVAIDLSGDIQSVRRDTPYGTWNGNPPVYYPRAGERIYRDFIQGISPSGVTITLWGLGVNRDCNITIWAFDDLAVGDHRIANWYANGTHILDTNFIGGSTNWPRYEISYPGDLYKWAFSGRATADELGTIVLTSSRDPCSPAGQPFAFVNALVVEPNVYVPFVLPNCAHRPLPLDGAEDVSANVVLNWRKGGLSETHDVYLGTDFDDVNNADRGNPLDVLVSQDHTTTTYTPPESLDFNTTYYWRIDEVNSAPDYTIFKGEVWSFTTHVPVLIASQPVPLDGARGVPTNITLEWTKGDYAEKHDVYFGTDQAAVTDANRSNTMGVLASQDHPTATYTPPESLDSDITYYWRVDEVNSAPDYTIFKGDLWSFTTYSTAPPGTVDPPYEVGTWQGFRTAAITYTFDDGRPGLYSSAIPMFNEPNFGFKLTAFIVTNWSSSDWTALQAAAAEGHEIASHTVSHPALSGLSLENLTAELVNSQNIINSHIPGQQCDTLAYPNCDSNPTVRANTALYYIAARGCSGVIEANTPADFYNISSFVCGVLGVNTPADFNSKFASTASSKGWCIFLIHGLDDDDWYSPLSSATLRASLDYLNTHRSTFWVDTFGNVVRYIRERNAVSVTELSDLGSTITVQVTDPLGDANYSYPITIRRPLPGGWSSAFVSQDGRAVASSIVDVNSTAYVMFDVVPDDGNVVLSKYYGDFTGNGIVDMNDLSIFRTYWLIDDCDGTEGVDLDEDCLVNFYEYAFLAKNWLLNDP
jgi:oligosaccharide reducing-end xylanase